LAWEIAVGRKGELEMLQSRPTGKNRKNRMRDPGGKGVWVGGLVGQVLPEGETVRNQLRFGSRGGKPVLPRRGVLRGKRGRFEVHQSHSRGKGRYWGELLKKHRDRRGGGGETRSAIPD